MEKRLLFATLVLGLPGILCGQIGPVRAKAWVAVNGDGSMVNSSLNFNSSGQANTVARTGTGQYQISYTGLGNNPLDGGVAGITQVTSRSAAARCKNFAYSASGADIAQIVQCRDHSGNLVDSSFNALYYRESRQTNEGLDGYLWANQPTTSSYIPNLHYSWNSKGRINSVTRSGTGVYTTLFPGLGGTPAAHVQATASGGDSAYCNLSTFTGNPDVLVTVNCFTPAGNPVDAAFLISMMSDVAVGVKETAYQGLGGFAFADSPFSASYTPVANLGLNTAGGTLTASRSGTGAYTMNFANLGSFEPFIVVVTAVGSNGTCSVGSVSGDSNSGTNVSVSCTDPAGNPQDNYYEILFLTSIPARAKAWVYVNANGTQSSSYNSSGLPNLTSRQTTGRYNIINQGLAAPQNNGFGGMVQVSSATPGVRCKSRFYSTAGGDVIQTVQCRNSAGADADAAFTNLYYIESRQATTWTDAYVWGDQPAAASYVPDPGFSWNSKGGTLHVDRTGTGAYDVRLGGLGPNSPIGGHAQVSSYGADNGYCLPYGWFTSGADVVVQVHCYAPGGAPADAQFLLSYMSDVAVAASVAGDATPGAYAFTSSPTAVSYIPSSQYSLNSSGGAILASRTNTGAYAMNFGGLPVSNSTIALVSAYEFFSIAAAGCSTAPPAAGANNGVSIGVNCFSPAGAAADVRYDLLYLTHPSAARLGMTVSHTGNFIQGQTGATYSILVNNGTGVTVGSTNGTVTVTEAPPAGLTITSMSGVGWTCNTSTCTRSDALVPGGDYPVITVTVNVGAAAVSGTNIAILAGGGSLTAGSVNDATTVTAGCGVTLSASTATIGAAAGGSLFGVAAGALCSWTASSNAAWLGVSSGFRTGNALVSFSVTANPNPTPRSGVITVSGATITVTQDGTMTVGNSTALRFVAVTPCRIADTRNANGPLGGPSLAGSEPRDFNPLASACGIPATAVAYSLNLTVVPLGPLGFLSVWPAGQPQATVSTLNSTDGRVKANSAIVPAGLNGAVTLFASNPTHAIVDINGYFVAASGVSNLAYYAITPCRLADTRNANGSLGGPILAGGAPRTFPVPGNCGIPAGASAYAFNMTVVPGGPLGFLSVWPAGQAQPGSSTLNATTGTVTSNLAIVPAGAGGSITAIATNDTHLIIDVHGYFAAPGAGSLDFYTVTPCRVADTRLAAGSLGGPALGAGAPRAFPVTASNCGIPANAQAYSMNATVVPPAGLGFLTLWGSGGQPSVSLLNAPDGSIVANATLVPAGSGGVVTAIATHVTNLILDINGYFR